MIVHGVDLTRSAIRNWRLMVPVMAAIVVICFCIIGIVLSGGADSEGETYTVDDMTYGIVSESERTAILLSYEGIAKEVTIPERVVLDGVEYTVTAIGVEAFYACSSLVSVVLPDTLEVIEDAAFYECISLRSMTIPDGISIIKVDMFYGCISLRSVTIPEGVTEIGTEAFYGCISLESVTIPASVTVIGPDVFSKCTSLTEFCVAEGNTGYKAVDGVLFTKDGKHLVSYPCGRVGPYTIPDGVIEIGFNMFSGCAGLTSIVIPGSIVAIKEGSFVDCKGLTSVIISNGVREIEYDSFSRCPALRSVTIPASVEVIQSRTFNECPSLTGFTVDAANIVYEAVDGVLFTKDGKTLVKYPQARVGAYAIPEGVESIASYAFSGCAGLTSVIISHTVLIIPDSAFIDCTGLSSVTIPGNVELIDYCAFSGCTSLESVTILNGVKKLESKCFEGCSALIVVTIPASVERISPEAFSGCPSLIGFVLDAANTKYKAVDGVLFTKDGKELLWYPKAREGPYVIPDGVTSISISAFSECTRLTSVTIPGTVTAVKEGLFSMCTSLESVTILNGVKSIQMEAFRGCSSLASVSIPNSVVYIGHNAFSGCSSLTTIFIPASVTEIGYGLFLGCTSLANIEVDEDNADYMSIDGVLFNEDGTLLMCYPPAKVGPYEIPLSVTEVRGLAFMECTGMTEFVVSDNHAVFSVIDGVLFNKDGTQLILCPNGWVGPYRIPDGTIYVNLDAFDGCVGITSLTIPATVKYADFMFVSDAPSMTEIILEDGFANGEMISVDGVLMDKDSEIVYWCPAGKTGTLSLPATIQIFEYWSFIDSKLSEIALNGGDRLYIDLGALSGCNPELKFVSGREGFDLEAYWDAEMTNAVTGTDLSSGVYGMVYLKWIESPAPASDDGVNIGIVIGAITAVIALVGVSVFLFMRRRA